MMTGYQTPTDLESVADREIRRLRAELASVTAELAEARRDVERLDQFEQWARKGACPALVFDDIGHWAVAFDGIQSVPPDDDSEVTDLWTSFFVEAAKFRNSVRAAIDAAMETGRESRT